MEKRNLESKLKRAGMDDFESDPYLQMMIDEMSKDETSRNSNFNVEDNRFSDYSYENIGKNLYDFLKKYLTQTKASDWVIDSCSEFYKNLIPKILKFTLPLYDGNGEFLGTVSMRDANVSYPKNKDFKNRPLFPVEAENMYKNYSASVSVVVEIRDADGNLVTNFPGAYKKEESGVGYVLENFCEVPIAVKSNKCNLDVQMLSKLYPEIPTHKERLQQVSEDITRPGGYFIRSGKLKVVVTQEGLASSSIIINKMKGGGFVVKLKSIDQNFLVKTFKISTEKSKIQNIFLPVIRLSNFAFSDKNVEDTEEEEKKPARVTKKIPYFTVYDIFNFYTIYNKFERTKFILEQFMLKYKNQLQKFIAIFKSIVSFDVIQKQYEEIISQDFFENIDIENMTDEIIRDENSTVDVIEGEGERERERGGDGGDSGTRGDKEGDEDGDGDENYEEKQIERLKELLREYYFSLENHQNELQETISKDGISPTYKNLIYFYIFSKFLLDTPSFHAVDFLLSTRRKETKNFKKTVEKVENEENLFLTEVMEIMFNLELKKYYQSNTHISSYYIASCTSTFIDFQSDLYESCLNNLKPHKFMSKNMEKIGESTEGESDVKILRYILNIIAPKNEKKISDAVSLALNREYSKSDIDVPETLKAIMAFLDKELLPHYYESESSVFKYKKSTHDNYNKSKYVIDFSDEIYDEFKNKNVINQLRNCNEYPIYIGNYNYRKLIQIAQLHAELFKSQIGKSLRAIEDKDKLSNKEFQTPGILFALTFNREVSHMKNNIQKKMTGDGTTIEKLISLFTLISTSGFSLGNAARDITNILNRNLGAKWDGVKKGIAQALIEISPITLIDLLTTVMGGDVGHLTGPREVKATNWGFKCPISTSEDQHCGTKTKTSITTYITTHQSPDTVYGVLRDWNNKTIITYNNSKFETIKVGKSERFLIKSLVYPQEEEYDTVISVNGALYGFCNGEEMRDYLIDKRRKGTIHKHTSIILLDYNQNIGGIKELEIYTIGGRMVRPLFIVKDNYLLIHKENAWTLDMNELLRKGFIEYVDAKEAEFLSIADYPHKLIEEKNRNFTHCEIHPSAITGAVTSVVPGVGSITAPRANYGGGMGKQAHSNTTTGILNRYRKESMMLSYPQRMITTTPTREALGLEEKGMGHLPLVAFSTFHEDGNYEDGVIINKSYIERGGGNYIHYNTITAVVPPDSIMAPGEGAKYSNIEPSGIIRKKTRITEKDLPVPEDIKVRTTKVIGNVSTVVKKGDILVATRKAGKGNTIIENTVAKSQIPHKISEIRQIDSGSSTRVEIVMTAIRPIEPGDKVSAPYAQKGVVCRLVNSEDMPFTDSGKIADIVINPHALPSRMSVSQVTEMMINSGYSMEDKRQYISNLYKNNYDFFIVPKYEKYEIVYMLYKELRGVKDEEINVNKIKNKELKRYYQGKLGKEEKILKLSNPIAMKYLLYEIGNDKINFNKMKKETKDFIVNFNPKRLIPVPRILDENFKKEIKDTRDYIRSYSDASAYAKGKDLNKLTSYYKKMGYDPYLREQAYDPYTGLPLDEPVFYAPSFYMFLKHIAEEKANMRSFGTVNVITNQPDRGKGGGQKTGNMESNVLSAYSVPSILKEVLLDQADKTNVVVDINSGDVVSINQITGQLIGTEDQQAPVGSASVPHSMSLIKNNFLGLGVGTNYTVNTTNAKLNIGLAKRSIEVNVKEKEFRPVKEGMVYNSEINVSLSGNIKSEVSLSDIKENLYKLKQLEQKIMKMNLEEGVGEGVEENKEENEEEEEKGGNN